MDKVVDLISQLAEKFGATGTELFRIYSAKIAVEGGVDLLTAAIIAALAYLGIGKLWRMAVNSRDMDAPPAMVGLVILSIVIGIVFVVLVNNGLTELLAPQGVAIERIVTHAK